MESFALIVNGEKLSTIDTKILILDVCGGPGWLSGFQDCLEISQGIQEWTK